MIDSLYDLFQYSTMTYLGVEKINNEKYIVGFIDTRKAEIDIQDIDQIIADLIPNKITLCTS